MKNIIQPLKSKHKTKKDKIKLKDEFIKTKIKEARDLVDALEMRKATLYKIGLMIVEYQYEFFKGGEIKPMKLKDLAEEFGHAPSTISRAISNKFLNVLAESFRSKTSLPLRLMKRLPIQRLKTL